jgi:EAL domain-containing protein (putative c-di-GMP-specific phosphodiesterase class I)
VIGFEALIRWESPTRGLVPPNDFIDILEESSLIHPIGDWIQKRAFWDIQALAKKFGPEIFMSLNISVRQLENSLFIDSLIQNSEQFSIDPQRVKLEITERILLEGQTGLQALSEAKKAGYLISIDDFGTGYSNFQSLTQFGFDSLKLDRGFLRAAMADPKMGVVLKGIIDIASGLNMGLIAEGIETEIEHARLKELGVPMGQGYLFARPQPLNKITA